MRSSSSALKAERAKRIDRLKERLDTLTQDYAAFIEGFSFGVNKGFRRAGYPSVNA
jgi:hypothetical protein